MKTLIVAAAIAMLAGCSEPKASGKRKPPDTPGSPPAFFPLPAPTGPDSLMRFVVVGDTGTGSEKEYRVADQIGLTCAARGCDFIVLLGDNIYPAGACAVDDPQFEEKVRLPYLALGHRVRAVLGNHDYGGVFPELTCAEAQVAYSTVQPLWEMPARFHSSEEGPALLLFLDTTPAAYTASAAYTADQAAYLGMKASSSTKPWRLAFGHSPLVSNGLEHGNAGEDMAAFLREILCERVDVYFAGHDHHREVLVPPVDCPVTQVISGAGAKLGEIGDDVPTQFASATLGFAYVEVEPDALTIEMYDVDGRMDFTITLTR